MKTARRTGFTAMPLSGAEAGELGLAAVVTPPEELAATTAKVAADLAGRPPGELLYLKARLKAAEALMDTSVPAITGLLVSHFLQADRDELDFWRTARESGVSGALDADKARTGAIDPRGGTR
jgi:enoyl-CoA hydratase/carnithine racemase